MKALALAGNGIALLPTFVAQSEVQAGSLVRLLPEWRANRDPIHLVYPSQRFMPPRMRVFIEEALVAFKPYFKG